MESSNNYFEMTLEFRQCIDWINQILMGDENVSITINGVVKPSISKSIEDHFSATNAMVQGRIQYKTKLEMDTAGAPPDKELAEVWNDPIDGNNGLYGWDGAWVPSKYGTVQADSIGHIQLKNDFLSAPALVGDESLNSIVQDGYHYCASGHSVKDLPSNFPAGGAFVVFVADILSGSDRFKYQTIYLWNDPKKLWFRQFDTQQVIGDWTDGYQIIVSQQIADKSIPIEKLGSFLTTRENLEAGTDLNLIETEGFHYGMPNGGYLHTPADYDGTSAFVIFNTATSFKGTRFKLQQFYLFNDPSKSWVRRSDNLTDVGWTNQYQLKKEQFSNVVLDRSHLSDSFMANGVLANNGDLNTLIKDGVFWLSSSNVYLNVPADWQGHWSGILFNSDATGAGRFIHQVLIRYGYPNQRWERTVDITEQLPSEWVDIGKSSSRDSLEDHFLKNDVLYEGDLNALTKDGTFTLVKTGVWENYPPTKDSVQLFNIFSDSDWLLQRAVSLVDHSLEWSRLIRVGKAPSTFPDWFLAGSRALDNPHKGMKIAYFGDSIVEFGTLPEQLGNLLDAEVYKMGFGGCRMAYHSMSIYNPMSMCQISGNIKSGDFTSLIDGAEALFLDKGDDNRTQAALVRDTNWSEVDLVIIAFGTNDFSGNVPIGTPSAFGPETFLGAMNKVVDDLLTAYPHLKLVFLTPIYRARFASGDGLNSDDHPNASDLYLLDYVDAILSQSKLHKVVSKDMYRTSNIGKLTSDYYLSDGVHPSSKGYTHLARKVAGLLRSEF
ncbi:SGNH/GDSL hydrolase family protein [Vibrio parahaemolyticus]|uniref:SGNH/GDSL hydrolase family protein n=1 Tax=Vibrio parahaemolyticus TaxID=670 RepID=UPI00387A8956